MFRFGRLVSIVVVLALGALACRAQPTVRAGPVDYDVVQVTELGDAGDVVVFLSPDGAHGLLGQPGGDPLCFAGLFTSRDACFEQSNPALAESLDWHEDGRRAVFSHWINPDLFLVDAELGTTQVLTEDDVWGPADDPIQDRSPVWVGDEIVALRDESLIVVSDSDARVLSELGSMPVERIVAGDDVVWLAEGPLTALRETTIRRVGLDGSMEAWTVPSPDVRSVPELDRFIDELPLFPVATTERGGLILYSAISWMSSELVGATGTSSGLWLFDGEGDLEPVFTDGTVEDHVAGAFVAYAPWDDTITYLWTDTSPVGAPVARVSRIAASTDWPVHPSAGDVLYEAAPGVVLEASNFFDLPINSANQIAIIEDDVLKLIEFG